MLHLKIPTRIIMVMWDKTFQIEIMVEFYSKSLAKSITREIELEHQTKTIKVMTNGLCL